MQKTTLVLLAITTTAGIGTYFFAQHRSLEISPSTHAEPVTPRAPSSKPINDDLTRRKLEGISNTRELKPVPLPKSDGR